MSKLQVDKLFIKDIRILKGEIYSPFDTFLNSIKDFETNMTFNVHLSEESCEILALFSVTINTVFVKNTELKASANFELAFIFGAANFEEMVIPKEDNSCDVDSGLLNAVASISYSTSRGILQTRLQGTLFKDFVLPIIHPNSLFNF